MEVNQAMLLVAEEVARELGYVDAGTKIIVGSKDSFWGNREMAADKQVISCKYILPFWEDDENEIKPKIEIDMQWGSPRLGIRYPDGSFCNITYKDGEMSEAQAFHENGLSNALDIKQRIDKLINQ